MFLDPGLKHEVVVPRLAAALRTASDDAAIQISSVLGNLGTGAAPAIPAILERLGGPCSQDARSVFIDSLGRIARDDPAAVPALVAALDDEKLRLAAIEALGRARTAAKAALPALRKVGRTGDEAVQHAAAVAIDRIEGK